eukprot:15451076-Alexandrium_andersonii.AAC.1
MHAPALFRRRADARHLSAPFGAFGRRLKGADERRQAQNGAEQHRTTALRSVRQKYAAERCFGR